VKFIFSDFLNKSLNLVFHSLQIGWIVSIHLSAVSFERDKNHMFRCSEHDVNNFLLISIQQTHYRAYVEFSVINAIGLFFKI